MQLKFNVHELFLGSKFYRQKITASDPSYITSVNQGESSRNQLAELNPLFHSVASDQHFIISQTP